MGSKTSKITPPVATAINTENNTCNYDCPICKQSGKEPNINGKFFLINDLECQCNGCNTIFPKERFYAKVVDSKAV
jgi:hypothetical protein